MSRFRNMSKSVLFAVIALSLTTFGVALAQLWPNLPLVNGGSYCSSTVNNSCVNTVPAGPAMSGYETIPADTNLSQGRSPQVAKFSLAALGLGPSQFEVPVNGTAVSMGLYTRQIVLIPAGTIATASVYLQPAANLVEGQRIGICTTQIVTSFTLNAGSGTTVTGAPTAMLVPVTTGGASCPEWVYRASNTTWYRVH